MQTKQQRQRSNAQSWTRGTRYRDLISTNLDPRVNTVANSAEQVLENSPPVLNLQHQALVQRAVKDNVAIVVFVFPLARHVAGVDERDIEPPFRWAFVRLDFRRRDPLHRAYVSVLHHQVHEGVLCVSRVQRLKVITSHLQLPACVGADTVTRGAELVPEGDVGGEVGDGFVICVLSVSFLTHVHYAGLAPLSRTLADGVRSRLQAACEGGNGQVRQTVVAAGAVVLAPFTTLALVAPRRGTHYGRSTRVSGTDAQSKARQIKFSARPLLVPNILSGVRLVEHH